MFKLCERKLLSSHEMDFFVLSDISVPDTNSILLLTTDRDPVYKESHDNTKMMAELWKLKNFQEEL